MSQTTCESCGNPIDQGPYCAYCVDSHGERLSFDEVLDTIAGSMMQKKGGTRADAERDAKALMRTLPAWKDHPRANS